MIKLPIVLEALTGFKEIMASAIAMRGELDREWNGGCAIWSGSQYVPSGCKRAPTSFTLTLFAS
jgi:hypothetical protein